MEELQALTIRSLKEMLRLDSKDFVGIDTLTRLLDRVTDIILREKGK